jgi:hypothetical protein
MRARNVKPSFFQNEQLAELPFEARLLFVGLWCMADREGRLEDRPKRIKMHVFPADMLDVEPLLQGLAAQNLIVRYSVNGGQYIAIPNFSKHQRPHSKEAQSQIPAFHEEPKAPTKVGASTDLGSGEHALNPDPPFLNPDCSTFGRGRAQRATRLPDDFSLTSERILVAEAEKLPAERTFAKFCDYWRSAAGAKARKHDWDATWRNWCRSEADRSRGNGTPTKERKTRYELMQETLRNATES